MALLIACPHCSAKLRLASELVGRKIECQRCHEMFLVPAAGPRQSEPPAPAQGEPHGTDKPRGKGPPSARNPWLLLALLLGGTVAVGTAVLFGISALTSDSSDLGTPQQASAGSPRPGDGGIPQLAPPRLPLLSPERPKPTDGPAPRQDSSPANPSAPADKAADKPADDGLAVISTPPATVRRGETFRYQIRVRSRNGGVRYRLQTGPPDMRVFPDGEVVWRVPGVVTRGEQKVSVLVTDGDGNRVAHRFTLKVVGAGKD